jgi:prevent-host-death family protein
MVKQYSIAEARNNLPGVVDEAQAGTEVRLTRRGQQVAVVVSVESFERLRNPRARFSTAYKDFRAQFPEKGSGVDPRYWRSLRDLGQGRKVDL